MSVKVLLGNVKLLDASALPLVCQPLAAAHVGKAVLVARPLQQSLLESLANTLESGFAGRSEDRKEKKMKMRRANVRCLFRWIPLWTIVFFVGLSFPTAQADSIVLHPTDDSYTAQKSADQNYGNISTLRVRNPNDGGTNDWEVRTLIRFDLSGVPGGSEVYAASLHLYYRDHHDNWPTGHWLELYRLSAGWSEDTVTWNNQPDIEDSHTKAQVPAEEGDWIVWNVTDDVRLFLAGRLENHGWAIRDSWEWGHPSIPITYCTSKDNPPSLPDHTPYLEIVTSGGTYVQAIQGDHDDVALSVAELAEGALALAGWTTSSGGGRDILVSKISGDSTLEWMRSIGTSQHEEASSVTRIGSLEGPHPAPPWTDIAITGWIWTDGSGDEDIFIAGLTDEGGLSWARRWGGSLEERAYQIVEGADGRLCLAGSATSFNIGHDHQALIACYDMDTHQLQYNRLGGINEYWARAIAPIGTGFVVADAVSSSATHTDGFIATFDADLRLQKIRRFDLGFSVKEIGGVVPLLLPHCSGCTHPRREYALAGWTDEHGGLPSSSSSIPISTRRGTHMPRFRRPRLLLTDGRWGSPREVMARFSLLSTTMKTEAPGALTEKETTSSS